MRLVISILLTFYSTQLLAQDFNLSPSFGEITLASGFDPDPHQITVYAGGTSDLSSSLEFSCNGFVSDAPDLRLEFSETDGILPLSFFAESEVDTILLINAPDGSWHCNDDFSEDYGLTAGIEFENPEVGIYDIWVGTYDAGSIYSEAQLYISEFGFLLNPEYSELIEEGNAANAGYSGTAFVVSNRGHLITNYHVVEGCENFTFQIPGEPPLEAVLISTNQPSDLALLRTSSDSPPLRFRSQSRLRLGDEIVVYGFPLLGDLSTQGNLTQGVVSALNGINDDLSTFQLSAQIQPGNSGGPVFNRYGELTGVVVSKANEEYFIERSGSIPQNVNFAIWSNIVEIFLSSNNVNYLQSDSQETLLSSADIADIARLSTGSLVCR